MQYLVQLNIYLFLFYGFYWIFLKKETFYNLNRAYLVGSAVLSFGIPFWYSDYIQSLVFTQQINDIIYSSIQLNTIEIRTQPQANPITLFDVLKGIYFSCFIFFFLKLIFNFLELRKRLSSDNQEFRQEKAFSFFKFVFVDKDLQNRETILAHEYVHIRQLHSFDVILFEIIGAVCWFNPIAYYYKKAIKNIHEFIADEIASKHEASKADYAMLLFSQQFGLALNPQQLTNQFFSKSTLKTRIEMLQKPRSKRTALLKYGLTVPLFMLMLVIASASIAKKTTEFPKLSMVNDLILNSVETPISSIKIKETIPTVFKDDSLNEDIIFSTVTENPQYKGGIRELYQFLIKEVKYPADARSKNIEGNVFVRFVVEPDGTITNPFVLKGIGGGCDEEAKRVVAATSGNWIGGKQNGKPVRVYYTLPIKFLLESKKKEENGQKLDEIVVAGFKKEENEFPLGAATKIEIQGSKNGIRETPLFIIDGSIVEKIDIKPEDITSVSVLKDKSAIALYGEKGKNGVVFITTKKNTSIKWNDSPGTPNPIYMIDDKEVSKEIIDAIKPESIESVNVLKDKSATAIYGEKGKNGVVVIKLKK